MMTTSSLWHIEMNGAGFFVKELQRWNVTDELNWVKGRQMNNRQRRSCSGEQEERATQCGKREKQTLVLLVSSADSREGFSGILLLLLQEILWISTRVPLTALDDATAQRRISFAFYIHLTLQVRCWWASDDDEWLSGGERSDRGGWTGFQRSKGEEVEIPLQVFFLIWILEKQKSSSSRVGWMAYKSDHLVLKRDTEKNTWMSTRWETTFTMIPIGGEFFCLFSSPSLPVSLLSNWVLNGSTSNQWSY